MLEFLFGVIIGVWMGQSVSSLPSVNDQVQKWWSGTPITEPSIITEENVPIFTGNMTANPAK